jgi:hypothetical protein
MARHTHRFCRVELIVNGEIARDLVCDTIREATDRGNWMLTEEYRAGAEIAADCDVGIRVFNRSNECIIEKGVTCER